MPKQSALPVVPFPPVNGDESLPPDLQYALRAASWAAGAGESLILAPHLSKKLAKSNTDIFAHLWESLPPARHAVESVAFELAAARQSGEPIHSAGVTATSWHELAIKFAEHVLHTAEFTAHILRTVDGFAPDAAPLDAIRTRWGCVTTALSGIEELDDGWQAALRLESIRAAGARRYEHSFNEKPVTEAPSANGTKSRANPRRGRPVDTDTKQDKQIWDAWHYRNTDGTKHYRTYAELAKVFKLTPKKVSRAIDRERKRRKKNAVNPSN